MLTLKNYKTKLNTNTRKYIHRSSLTLSARPSESKKTVESWSNVNLRRKRPRTSMKKMKNHLKFRDPKAIQGQTPPTRRAVSISTHLWTICQWISFVIKYPPPIPSSWISNSWLGAITKKIVTKLIKTNNLKKCLKTSVRSHPFHQIVWIVQLHKLPCPWLIAVQNQLTAKWHWVIKSSQKSSLNDGS